MKVKVMREITKTITYWDIIDFNIDDDPYQLDVDLSERDEVIEEDNTWFVNPDTDETIDLLEAVDDFNNRLYRRGAN